ncbi:hypothetical protein P4131_17530 [Pseudomonas aeruginosa]|nr:hypothetical protein [Pseudomonas aeruginosa]
MRDFNTALGAGLPAEGERAPLPPALKQRPGPPPVLTPSYWKAASLPAEHPAASPRTTGPGLFAISLSSTHYWGKGIGNEGRAGTVAVDHLLLTFLGACAGGGKLLLNQIQKSLDSRFASQD